MCIRDSLDANPENYELKKWLDNALNIFDTIYGYNRPGFIDGYKKLKSSISSW